MSNIKTTVFLWIIFAGLGLLPFFAHSETASVGFSRQGIFGCNNVGGLSTSVGAFGAYQSSFVPVNDAALTLNTGTLVYKECVLRGLASRESDAATAGLVDQILTAFNTGRDGNPQFSTNLGEDQLAAMDEVTTNNFTNGRFDSLNPAFRDDVKRYVYRNYYVQTRNSNNSLACSYDGTPEQLKAVLKGKGTGGARDVLVLTDPNCIPLQAAYNAQTLNEGDQGARVNEMMTRLSWNKGVYDVETIDSNGIRRVSTPGFLAAGRVEQALGSGFRKQESANDIDQMVGSLFANVGTQILKQGVGLIGLTNSTAGKPSYLNQVVADANAGLRDSAINAAIQVLVAAKQVEMAFLDAENATANALASAIAKLRGAEASCWNLIIPKVKTFAGAANCTKNSDGSEACSSSGGNMKIATTTTASQAVIDAKIAPLATTTAARIQASTAAVGAIDKLIAGVINSNSPDAQRTALQQLDALVAQKVLHTQYDQKAAEQQLQDVQNSVGGIVTDTIKGWGDSTDPNIGWCNVNNESVIKKWADKWKS